MQMRSELLPLIFAAVVCVDQFATLSEESRRSLEQRFSEIVTTLARRPISCSENTMYAATSLQICMAQETQKILFDALQSTYRRPLLMYATDIRLLPGRIMLHIQTTPNPELQHRWSYEQPQTTSLRQEVRARLAVRVSQKNPHNTDEWREFVDLLITTGVVFSPQAPAMDPDHQRAFSRDMIPRSFPLASNRPASLHDPATFNQEPCQSLPACWLICGQVYQVIVFNNPPSDVAGGPTTNPIDRFPNIAGSLPAQWSSQVFPPHRLYLDVMGFSTSIPTLPPQNARI
jgi:hypothetical protein